LQLIDLKQAAEAQRQRHSLIAANSFAAIRFKAPAAAAQRQRSDSEAAPYQPIHLQLFDLKQPSLAQRQRSSPIPANSITAIRFKAPAAEAQRQRSDSAATAQRQRSDSDSAATAQRQ
jgi:hypothetical protein